MGRYCQLFLAAAVAGALTFPGSVAHAQNRRTSAAPATSDDYSNLADAKSVTGTLVSIDTEALTMTARLDISHLEPNPNYRPSNTNSQANAQWRQMMQQQRQYAQRYQSLMRRQQQALQAGTPQQRQQALRQIAQEIARIHQQQAKEQARQLRAYQAQLVKQLGKKPTTTNNGPFKVVTVAKDFEMNVKNGAVVRKLFLPLQFDDVGKVKVHTDEEKTALRGDDTTQPGYAAKLDDLFPNQEVTLHLDHGKRSKGNARPDDPLEGTLARPTVTKILMTKENTGGDVR